MMSRVLYSIASVMLLSCLGLAGQKSSAPASSSVPASALALMPKRTSGDTLHVETHVGSFKIVPKGPELPSGRLEFDFAGTVLVSELENGSYLQTTGDVHEEYSGHNKHVYFGKGQMLIVGRFKACEWFGRDLRLVFTGSAIFRVIAEFDKNGDTGASWYDPARKNPLQPNLMPVIVPEPNYGPTKAITREEFDRQKKQKGGH